MKLKNLSLGLVAAMLLFAACERDEMQELDEAETSQALNEAETNAYYDELDLMTSEAVAEAENGRTLAAAGFIPDCATLTHNAETRTSTIDFGTSCTDAKGNIRSGKIIISRSGQILQPGSSITTSLADYTVNGIAVEGVRVLSNISESSTSTPKFSVVLSGGRLSWPDGTTAVREVSHTRSWVRATNPANDEWLIEGTATGTNRQGQEYTGTISSALVVKIACRAESAFVPVKGTLVITRPDKVAVTLDYGNGACDNEVLVSANGRSKTITVSSK